MELTIEKLVAGGAGVAFVDGRPIFIPGTVPGDRVRCRVVKDHRSYVQAEVEALLAPGADRAPPRCPVFGVCGGCQWQHVHYEAQCLWKQRILVEQLRRIAKIPAPRVEPTIPASSPWHYRSRIQLQRSATGLVGFYRAGSHDVVEFDRCDIADATINAKLAAAKEQLRTTGQGRHVRSDGVTGFAQVHPAQNLRLQQCVADGVAAHGGGVLLELYCGNGNLTMPMAAVAKSIVAIDDHAASIRQASALAKQQQMMHVTFHCTSAEQYVHRELPTSAGMTARFDGIILDPPRRGAPEVLNAIAQRKPQWIGYVSCDPATLARDVRTLITAGFRHELTQPIDMFPQTHHIESVTWLTGQSG